MPRLNLDIFGGEAGANKASATARPAVTSTTDFVPKEKDTAKSANIAVRNPTVRFIPVGFHEEHLYLLDEAVLSLRRKGKWGASKSALIRALIDMHSKELEDIWLASKPV